MKTRLHVNVNQSIKTRLDHYCTKKLNPLEIWPNEIEWFMKTRLAHLWKKSLIIVLIIEQIQNDIVGGKRDLTINENDASYHDKNTLRHLFYLTSLRSASTCAMRFLVFSYTSSVAAIESFESSGPYESNLFARRSGCLMHSMMPCNGFPVFTFRLDTPKWNFLLRSWFADPDFVGRAITYKKIHFHHQKILIKNELNENRKFKMNFCCKETSIRWYNVRFLYNRKALIEIIS